MRKLLHAGHCRVALQFMAAGSIAALMSGCSSDVTRMESPFTNPFSTASNDEATPAAPARRVASASDVIPAGRTPPVSSQALAPRSGYASIAPSHETTGSIEPGPARIASGPSYGNWTTTGGTPIQVADGESADVLAQRYGVPTNVLLQVNGMRSASDVRPGSHITVPVYSTAAAARPERVAEAPMRAVDRGPHPSHDRIVETHTAANNGPKGKWMTGAPPAQVAAARAPGKNIVASAQVASRPVRAQQLVAVNPAPLAPVGKIKGTVQSAALAPARPARPERLAVADAPKIAVEPTPPAASQAAASPVAGADGGPEFRWPARGRIIQAFKGGSGGNDGINISVPEGTSVRAAEGGVVAYAGNELKGYGNLVLIRHPNGFVSAYANNGQIDVKRGETVKRGQEIAKSGQSGNVSSPQLHFELRKGSTPVDPTQYLAGL